MDCRAGTARFGVSPSSLLVLLPPGLISGRARVGHRFGRPLHAACRRRRPLWGSPLGRSAPAVQASGSPQVRATRGAPATHPTQDLRWHDERGLPARKNWGEKGQRGDGAEAAAGPADLEGDGAGVASGVAAPQQQRYAVGQHGGAGAEQAVGQADTWPWWRSGLHGTGLGAGANLGDMSIRLLGPEVGAGVTRRGR